MFGWMLTNFLKHGRAGKVPNVPGLNNIMVLVMEMCLEVCSEMALKWFLCQKVPSVMNMSLESLCFGKKRENGNVP